MTDLLFRGARVREELALACAGEGLRSFAVFDGARVRNLPVLLDKLGATHASLYRKPRDRSVAHNAPQLVEIDALDGPVSVWLDLKPDHLDAAIFCVGAVEFHALQRHLRRFLQVRDSEGRKRYFRFYDPRVVAPFLASSTADERRTFFGPLHALLAHREDDELFSADPALELWRASDPALVSEPAESRPAGDDGHPPDATHPFRVSARHEEAFSQVLWGRYRSRCIEHLRESFPAEVGQHSEAQLDAILEAALEAAGTAGLTAGRHVTVFAEAVAVGRADELARRLARAPAARRSDALWSFRRDEIERRPAPVSA
jgi:hypothetical protein